MMPTLDTTSAFDNAFNITITPMATEDGDGIEWLKRLTDHVSKWWFVLTFCFGIPGNIMSLMITLRKDNRRISTCIYMAALAVVDTGLIINVALHKTLIIHGWPGEWMKSSYAFLSYIWYANNVFAISSGLFLAEMSVDRAMAVTYPMKAATICTTSKAAKVTIATFIVECIIHSQAFWMYKIPEPANGAILRELPPDLSWAVTLFNMYMLVLGTILPFCILLVSNTIIILNIRRAAAERKKMDSGSQQAKDANLTMMLLLTSTAYLFCSCPKRIWETIAAAQYDMTNPYWFARYWLEFWIVTNLWESNFAVNFYVYFLGGGRKFRSDAHEVLTRFCKKST